MPNFLENATILDCRCMCPEMTGVSAMVKSDLLRLRR